MNKHILSTIIITTFILYSIQTHSKKNDSIPKVTAIPQNRNNTLHYQNGTYQGDTINTIYGNLQLQTTIRNGTITEIEFLQYPDHHKYSQTINHDALPALATEAIQNQTAEIDTYTGATETSTVFKQSLQSTLNKAKP